MRKPLLERVQPLEGQSITTRYNVFVDQYNREESIIDGVPLERVPDSSLFVLFFRSNASNTGRILFLFALCIPFVDCLVLLLALYAGVLYCGALVIHGRNGRSVHDPFKRMVFDPEMCFNLKRDYYTFNIEFKELEGFSLNYNREIKREYNLRQQRGKARFLIYNHNLWASYYHFPQWKKTYIGLTLTAMVLVVLINVGFVVYFL